MYGPSHPPACSCELSCSERGGSQDGGAWLVTDGLGVLSSGRLQVISPLQGLIHNLQMDGSGVGRATFRQLRQNELEAT